MSRGARATDWSQVLRGEGRDGPVGHGVGMAAFQALGYGVVGSAVGAGGLGLEGVEGLAALVAGPVVSDWGCGLAGWAGEAVAAGGFGSLH